MYRLFSWYWMDKMYTFYESFHVRIHVSMCIKYFEFLLFNVNLLVLDYFGGKGGAWRVKGSSWCADVILQSTVFCLLQQAGRRVGEVAEEEEARAQLQPAPSGGRRPAGARPALTTAATERQTQRTAQCRLLRWVSSAPTHVVAQGRQQHRFHWALIVRDTTCDIIPSELRRDWISPGIIRLSSMPCSHTRYLE